MLSMEKVILANVKDNIEQTSMWENRNGKEIHFDGIYSQTLFVLSSSEIPLFSEPLLWRSHTNVESGVGNTRLY